MTAAFPTVASLVPHGPPMILLDAVTAHAGDAVSCILTLREDSPFMHAGAVPATLALEYMAQACAVHAGLHRGKEAPAKMGYLIGVRRLDLACDTFEVGETLHVHATRTFGDRQLGQFDCTVTRNDDQVAAATLSVAEPDSPKETP